MSWKFLLSLCDRNIEYCDKRLKELKQKDELYEFK